MLSGDDKFGREVHKVTKEALETIEGADLYGRSMYSSCAKRICNS